MNTSLVRREVSRVKRQEYDAFVDKLNSTNDKQLVGRREDNVLRAVRVRSDHGNVVGSDGKIKNI